MRKTPLGWLP